jgi:hypothetical protein
MLAGRRVMSRPPVISASLDTATRAVISWTIRQDNMAQLRTALELAERLELVGRT